MADINGLGSNNSLAKYLNSTSNTDLDAKMIFKKLSIDAGSDGKSISKGQLDSYVASKKENKSAVSAEELTALAKIQEQWDSISGGSDKITYAAMSGKKSLLTSMDTADIENKYKDAKSIMAGNKADINAFLVDAAFRFSIDDDNSSSGFSSLLKTLLSGNTDENDDQNADLIATLVNLIADFNSDTSVDVEA